MTIALYLKDKAFCKKLRNALEKIGEETEAYFDFEKLYGATCRKNKKIDLIIADITLQQANESLQRILSDDGKRWIPVVFYNDPYKMKEKRTIYWFKQNLRAIEIAKLNDETYEYNTVFKFLDGFLTKGKKFSPAMSKLLDFFKCNLEKEVNSADIIKALSKISKSEIGEKSVYTYISRLKKEIAEKCPQYEIRRAGKETYTMMLCDI